MKSLLLPLIVALFISCTGTAQQTQTQIASTFLGTLSRDQQEKTVFHFTDDERYNWHFIPRSRKGISFNEMNEQQRKAALDLLKTCLSENGYRKATDVMQHEKILRMVEGRGETDDYRNPGNYYLTLFDKPSDKEIWGWRIEGHHISFTFSMKNNQLVAGTPGFLGANPAIVQDGPQKGKQILKEETDMGFALLNSLTNEQKAKAVFSDRAPSDIITSASRKASIDNQQGIKYAELTADQQSKFMKLVEVYIHRYTKLFADDMIKDVKAAGLNNMLFAWAGAQDGQSGRGTYYRIQGPTIIIEYDNTQNGANHVHSVLRDLKNDFGGDELLQHYKSAHAGK